MANRLSLQFPFGNRSHSGPHQPVPLEDGSVHTLSSFGLDHTTLGPDWDAKGLINSFRKKTLEYRSRYYQCTQHDHKTHDWNGRLHSKGNTIAGIQPLIGNSAPEQYVTMDQRRPSAPYRLGRVIVNAFTTMLFGYGRWPAIKSPDPDTQDFVEALNKSCKLHTKMLKARAIGGGCGTVGLSWKFRDGKPRVSVHAGKNIFIKEWEDEEEGIPSHVIEIFTVVRDVRGDRGQVKRKEFWKRRDWTPVADVVFREAEVGKENPAWSIDEERSYVHDDKFCHFVWIRNLPDDEEDGNPDGQPDYAEVYEQLNVLDILNSVVCKGGILNLDPTLVVKLSAEQLDAAYLQKGSENALAVGETGDAHYMELAGTSITSGVVLIDKERDQILETVQCVIIDPNEAAAQGTSSVAMKITYAPMMGQTDILRDNYGEGIIRVDMQMLEHCRLRMPIADADSDNERYLHEAGTDEEGNPTEEPVDYYVNLPPRIETEQVLDAEGQPTGDEKTIEHDRVPGKGEIELEWGDYFKPTAQDRQMTNAALTTATGGKPVMSQRTAVDIAADAYGKDGAAEWVELTAEQAQLTDAQNEMFPPMGGEVEDENELPGGALPDDEQSSAPEAKLELPGNVIEAVITVDEARAALGHAPIGGPEGKLTVAASRAQATAQGTEAGKVVGAAQGALAVQPEAGEVPAEPEGAVTEPEAAPAEQPPTPQPGPTDGIT